MWRRRFLLAAVALAVVTLVGSCGGDGDADRSEGRDRTSTSSSTLTSTTAPMVEHFVITSRNHVQGRIAYPMTPPVGGDHNPVWQNCGFYSQPVEPELAVHSMEHGAVWITYRPDLPKPQVDALRQLARSRPYVLVSPWRDTSLPAPVVASAWGVQLKLPSATHPALADFVRAYAGGSQAPERGAACTGAVGTPES